MKNVFKKFLVFSAVISLAFTGCNDIVDVGSSNEENATAHVAGKAVLSLSVNQNSTRTIMPTNISEADVTQIELSATKSGADGTETAYSFSIDSETLSDSIQWLSDEDKTAIANMENSTITIDYGTYTFTLKLYTGEPSRLRLTQSAVLENVEITKETTSLAFEAKYVEKGDLSLTIQFDSDFDITKRIGAVKAGLFTMSSKGKTAVTGYDYEELSYLALTNEKAASYTKTGNDAVPNGTYYVKFQIYAPATGNEEVGELLNTISEIVKIHGYKTEKTINIASEYLNALYSVIYNLSNEKTAWKDGVEESLTTKRNIYTGITLPVEDDISCSGWKLLGWYEKDSDGNPIDADNDGETDLITTIGTGTETAKDYTLYAKWEKETVTTAEDTFSVSIKVDDSSDISATHTENNTSLTFTVTPPDSKAAYSYAWTVDGVAETPTSEPTFTVDGSDWATGIYEISLIATETKTDSESGETATNYYSYLAQIEWTRLYTVRFNITGAPSGTAEVEPQYVAENAKTKMITAPADVTPTYGWYTDAEFTEEFDFTSEVTKSMTLYGRWNVGSKIYVDATGEDGTGRGTASRPLATIAAAVALMTDEDVDYTIYVDGELTGGQEIKAGSALASGGLAKSITLVGKNGDDSSNVPKDSLKGGFSEESSGRTLTVSTTVPVTIENLKITGGYLSDTGSFGGGLSVASGATVTLAGCTSITDNTASRGGGANVDGTLIMTENSTISGNTATGGYGGGVYVGYDDEIETVGTFVMEGGTISGNEAVSAGGGVFVDGTSSSLTDSVTFTMRGGTISGNKESSTATSGARGGGGVALYGEHAQFTMEDGIIRKNQGNRFGGGVSLVESATFIMTGGLIGDTSSTSYGNYLYLNTENKYGSAVFVADSAIFTMDGGEISYNYNNGAAQGAYGTVCAYSGTFNMNGGIICHNNVLHCGGAVYIYYQGICNLAGGTIRDNICEDSKGSGVYIKKFNNDFGTLNMSGSAVIESGNDIYLPSGTSFALSGELTGDAPIATITPQSYSTDTTVLTLADGADTTLEAEYAKFAVTPQTADDGSGGTTTTAWKLTSEGKLAYKLGDKSSPDAVGDIVFTDGTALAYTEGMTLNDAQKAAAVAVIFYVGTGEATIGSNENILGSKTLGVGLKNATGDGNTLAWAPSNTTGYTTKFTDIQLIKSNTAPAAGAYYQYVYSGGTYYLTGGFDGNDNWTAVCNADSTASENAATNYPAFNWVSSYAATNSLTGDYASGWYLPSGVELHVMYDSKDTVNAALEKAGGTQISSDYYWSSSQYSLSSDSAWCVLFDDGFLSCDSKSSTKSVCAIRGFE